MMARIAWLLGTAMLATPALAQTVTLRSGDHPDRARLVLAIPAGIDWRLGRSAGGYGLRLSDPVPRIELGDVFYWIKRDRIADLSAEPGRLQLQLACDPCHATAVLLGRDRLVIDVIDGAAPEASPFEAPLDPAPAVTDLPDVEPAPATVAAAESAAGRGLLPVVFGLDLPAQTPEPAAATAPDAAPTVPDIRVSAAREAMQQGVARAAAQGLLQVDPDFVAIPPEQPAPPAADRPPDAFALPDPAPQPQDPIAGPPRSSAATARPGLAARSSIDRDLGGAAADAAPPSCVPAPQFDLADWADAETPFSTQLADLSAELAGEFGEIDSGSIEALSRFYLYHGFGREAVTTLRMDGRLSAQRRLLAAMGAVVDGEPVTTGVFEDQADCPGPVALWGALARGDLAGMSEPRRRAAVIAFSTLPSPIRDHLGARLAELFVADGDMRSAEEVLHRSGAVQPVQPIEAGLAAAEVALEVEGPEAAIEALDTIARTDARLPPDGMVRLIGLLLDQGEPVPDGILELARAMRFESRGAPEEAALAEAEARGLIGNAAHGDALALLAQTAEVLDPDVATALRSDIVIATTESRSDADFIAGVFDALPRPVSAEAVNLVAARLIALGFAERAGELLSEPASGPAMAERRYLRAEVALATGDAEALEAALAGLEDPRATRLRAAYLAGDGDHAGALDTAAADLDHRPAPEEVWRAGDWDVLEELDDPLMQRAAEAVLTPAPPPSPEASLAEGRSLLDEAEATRQLATDLLTRFELDDPGD